jgi:hypothetical protein
MRDKRKMLWNPTRTVVFQKVLLKESITCVKTDHSVCDSPEKCNRKNACNEALKLFFK